MSSLIELLNESYKVNGIYGPSIDICKMFEKEVKKYISSKFISWKYEINTFNSSTYKQDLYFLSEKGSIFVVPILLRGVNGGNQNFPYMWGINTGFIEPRIIECYTRDNCYISKFEKEETYIISKNDIIIKNFKNIYFYSSKNSNVINDFINLCENWIQKENDLKIEKDKYIHLSKKYKLEEENINIKNKAYQDALESNLKRQYEEELRVRKLEYEENNIRIKAQHDAIISSIKREYEEEIKMIIEKNNEDIIQYKNEGLLQRIKNIFI